MIGIRRTDWRKNAAAGRRLCLLTVRLLIFATVLLSGALLSCRSGEAADYPVSGRKYVFVGDSYALQRAGCQKPWPELFQEKLGIKPNRVLYARGGGYGIAKKGKQFLSLVRQLKYDAAVTDVIIMGGVGNDWHNTPAEITTACRYLNADIRRRFPNARIVYGYCNWRTRNMDCLRAMVAHMPYYKKAARDNGWIYLAGMEKILRDHPEYIQSDGHHPTQKAQILIASKMVSLYKKYCVNGISLNSKSVILDAENRYFKLRAAVTPSTASNKKLKWYSTRPSVASVSSLGLVKALTAGAAYIHVYTVDGGFRGSCKITVKNVRPTAEIRPYPEPSQNLG